VNARDITWRKRAEEALQAALQQESLYNRINQVFLTIPGEGMYADVLAIAREEVQSPYGIFGYIDEKGALVTPSFTSDVWDECRLPEKMIRWPPETWGGSIWGQSIREKRPLIKNAPGNVPSGHLPITRSMVVPILWEGSVIGTFELANKPTDYTREDLAVIERIAGQVAPVLHARLERDRKEKARAEAIKALRESEERYRTLFNSMDEGFCIIEMIYDEHERPIDYRFLEINPAFERQTGLPDAKGKRMREMVPVDEEFWFEIYGSIARTGEPRRFTHEAIPQVGGWYEVYAFPFGERGSNQVAVLFNDITDRKKAEEEREALMDRIEQAHREANLYLDILTHDIGNTENVSNLYTELLIDTLDGEAGAHLQKLQQSIRKSIEILATVGKIRKIHRGALALGPSDLDAVIQEEVGHYPDSSIRYESTPYRVQADALLPEIFANLIGNAVKHGGPGVAITIRIEEKDGLVRVSVEDTGPGIPDDQKEAIFHRYEQQKRGVGEGLGLYLVQILVERYGGRVWVEDRVPGHPEQGAAFRFTLKKAAAGSGTDANEYIYPAQ